MSDETTSLAVIQARLKERMKDQKGIAERRLKRMLELASDLAAEKRVSTERARILDQCVEALGGHYIAWDGVPFAIRNLRERLQLVTRDRDNAERLAEQRRNKIDILISYLCHIRTALGVSDVVAFESLASQASELREKAENERSKSAEWQRIVGRRQKQFEQALELSKRNAEQRDVACRKYDQMIDHLLGVREALGQSDAGFADLAYHVQQLRKKAENAD
jgi:hypothetical protein